MKRKYIIPLITLTIILSYCNVINSIQNNTLTITFIGDVIMHGPVKSFAFRNNIIDLKTKLSVNNGGFDILFENIAQEFSTSDYVVANMEFPVAPPYTSKAFIFNCPPPVLDAFKKININIVSIANNHILDQGYEGLIATLKMLESKGMQYTGIAKKNGSFQNGIIIGDVLKVGIIAYTGVMNYELSPKYKNSISINNFYDSKKVLNDISEIKSKCDFLVMIAHIGNEYSTQPSKKDMNIIRMYCEAGVDCVIGHHPHVIQPVEQIKTTEGRGCTVFYSLGNFIANQSSIHADNGSNVKLSTREGIIVNLTLKKKNTNIHTEYNVIPIMIHNVPETNSMYKYGRRIQTITIKRLITMKEEKENNQEIIKMLKNRLYEIEKHLFLYGKFDNIQYLY